MITAEVEAGTLADEPEGRGLPVEVVDEVPEDVPDDADPDDWLVTRCVVMMTVTDVVSEPTDELVRVSVINELENEAAPDSESD